MAVSHAHDHAKHVVFLLALLALAGLVLYLQAQGYELGSLPGDAVLAVAAYNVYFPTTTTVIVSLALNLAAYLCYSFVRHRLHMAREHAAAKRPPLVYPSSHRG
jgi:uncharacterized protein HemY